MVRLVAAGESLTQCHGGSTRVGNLDPAMVELVSGFGGHVTLYYLQWPCITYLLSPVLK